MFVGKVYEDGGIFKFHILANEPNINELDNSSAYLLKFLMCDMLDLDMLILTR